MWGWRACIWPSFLLKIQQISRSLVSEWNSVVLYVLCCITKHYQTYYPCNFIRLNSQNPDPDTLSAGEVQLLAPSLLHRVATVGGIPSSGDRGQQMIDVFFLNLISSIFFLTLVWLWFCNFSYVTHAIRCHNSIRQHTCPRKGRAV